MKDLIQRLRQLTPAMHGDWQTDLCNEAADALERLTARDVEFRAMEIARHWAYMAEIDNTDAAKEAEHCLQKHLLDYGNRRAAVAVLAERERCAVLMESQHTWITNVAAAALIRKGTP